MTHDVIVNLFCGKRSVIGIKSNNDQEVAGGLLDGESLILYSLRQHGSSALNLVLHLNLGNVGVSLRIEGQGNARIAGGIAFRFNIAQVIESGELLFDNLNNAVFNSLCGGAGIGCFNGDAGRSDARVLFNGHLQQ